MQGTGVVVYWKLIVHNSNGTVVTKHHNWDYGSFRFQEAVEQNADDPNAHIALYAVQPSGRCIETLVWYKSGGKTWNYSLECS